MRSVANILEEYRGADFEKRLNLFLECPSLRNCFMEINQSEMAGESFRATSRDANTLAKGSDYA